MFDARERSAALPSDPFQWIGMDGETYTLPNASTLTGADADRLFGGDLAVIREVGGQAAYDALMAMPARLQLDFATAWTKHSRESGKEASPSSPTRTAAKRSK
ncbi:hypothetical protein [Streptomyces sp. SBT349]|uniref:hypothetical protein n=1 Tax=Streptomyces sp. SBT349 TaxID=1580539 RepID=UPI00066C5945|nr:hypothetical protein [Streptomyces sp. SBT349]